MSTTTKIACLVLLAALAELGFADNRRLLSPRNNARRLVFGQTGVTCKISSCSATYPAAAAIANCQNQATLGKQVVNGECLRRDGGTCGDMGNNCNGTCFTAVY